MKQKLLNSFRLKATLLVAVLCALFTGTAWATDVTFTPGTDTGATSVTKSGVTATMTTMNNASYYQIYANQSATFSVASGNITKIEFTCTASGTSKYGPGNSSANVGSYSYSGTTGTWTGEASSITISSTAQVRMTSLTITYTAAAPSYTITAQSNNTSYGTVSLNGSVITGSPKSGCRYATPAYTVSSGTAAVSQSGNDFTVTPSSDCTVTINFEALPTYTVTFSDGGSVTQDLGGASVTLPSRSAIGSYTFAGWSETNVPSETTTAPTIISAGSYTPTGDITLYPVYTKAGGGAATPSAFSVGDTGDFAIVSAEQGGKYYALPTNPTVSSGKITAQEITVSETGGVKYVTTANASGFTWTIASATNGYTLSDGSKYIYHSNGGSSGTNLTYGTSTDYTWALTADGDYITMAGMSGSTTNNRGMLFQGTTIGGYALSNASASGYYKVMILPISAGSTTYYWSSPVAAAVERPEITIAENPFLFSTTATITCETEGAAIKYSYDNENWNDYSSELTITETKTIYAKAVKNEVESTVASVTATKNLATPTVTVSGDLTLDLDGETNVSAGTLTAAVTYNESAVGGATVTWESSAPAVATIDANGAVTLLTTGEVTFTATYAGNSDYDEATGTKTVTVINSNVPGSTEANPYTIAEAIDAIDNDGAVKDVYVEGIISQIDEYNSSYHSLTYWISADGTTESQQFEVYSGKGIGGANFSSINDLEVGDQVVVKGDIKIYNDIYEFNYNNQLVSRTEKPASDLAKTSDIALDIKNNALTANIADHINSSSTGAYTYESADPTVATVSAGGVVTGLKEGSTTITVNQAATLSFKAGTVEIPVTVADTREAATTIPAINISSLAEGDEGTISVVDPVKADESVTFSFVSSDEDVLYIEGDEYVVIGIGTATVTVTATASNSNLYKNVAETFDVTVNAAVKNENVIAYEFESYSTEYGTNLEGLVSGSTGFDGVVTATSSNVKVLTVAVDGEGNVTVTPVAVGSATVTFSAAETASFLAAEDVKQEFTVTAPVGIATAPVSGFVKVTATEDITDGEYLIVYEDGEVAFDGSLTTLDATSNTIDVEIADGVIAANSTTKAATFTIDVTAGTLQSKSGYYIGRTANSNGLDSNSETMYSNTFEIDGGNAVITASSSKVLQYNKNSGQTRFRYFGGTQQDIQLYKLTAASTTVTLNASGYATFCSVNPMDFSDTDGYTAWYIESITNTGVVTFQKITSSIKGGQGVLLYDKDATATKDVIVKFADSPEELSGNKLIGTTAPKYVEAGAVYGLSGSSFVKSKNSGNIGAGKAYIKAESIPSSVKAFTFVFEDPATGITETRTVAREEVEGIFNLAGQRLGKMQKGINIVNGKKVLVK